MASRRFSHKQVVDDWEQHAIKKLLKLEKVMPGLVERKVVMNKLGKKIVKHGDMDTLLGILKQKSLERFVDFLQALAETFPICEDHRELVNVMRESLEHLDLTGISAATRVAIQEVIAKATQKEQVETPLPDPQQMQPENASDLADEPVAMTLTSVVADVSSTESEVVKPKSTSTSKDVTAQELQGNDLSGCMYIEPCLTRQMQPEYVLDLPTVADKPVATAHKSVVSDVSSMGGEVVKPKSTSTSEVMMTPELRDSISFDSSGCTYVEPCRSWQFTREGMVRKEGLFHCPAHGIIGHIPATAVPPGIDSFEIHMKVFMQGDFRFPTDIEPCTAVVELTLYPNFVFIEDITIKIPHCVDGEIDPEAFCLLTASEEHAPMFEFTDLEEESVDSDSYHVIGKLRHFSPFVGGRRRRQSRSRTRSRGSISKKATPNVKTKKRHQTSADFKRQQSGDDGGCCELCIAQCMLHQCSGGWETNFLLSCAHPTGMLVLTQAVAKLCTGATTAMQMCRPNNSHLEFIAQEDREGWDVCVTTGTPVIDVQAVTQFHNLSDKLKDCLVSTGMYPTRVGYLVSSTDASRLLQQLRCRIDVKGAEVNGKPHYFMLTSPQITPTCTVTRRLHTCRDLYQPESNICSALSGSSAGTDLPLDSQCEDHRRFIADISFQLTKTDFQKLTGVLEMSQPELDRIMDKCGTDLPERIYQVLLSWMSRHYPNSSIKTLLVVLQKLGIDGIELSSWSDKSICSIIYCHISKNSIHSKDFMLAIALEIKQRWKFVGRFIGVSESDISAMTQEGFLENNVWEMSVQMLQKWQQQKAEKATYGTLCKAIYRVFEYEPSDMCSAWRFCSKHMKCKE